MFLASSAQVCDGLSYTVPLSWAHRAGSPLNSNTDIFIILPATTTKKTNILKFTKTFQPLRWRGNYYLKSLKYFLNGIELHEEVYFILIVSRQ